MVWKHDQCIMCGINFKMQLLANEFWYICMSTFRHKEVKVLPHCTVGINVHICSLKHCEWSKCFGQSKNTRCQFQEEHRPELFKFINRIKFITAFFPRQYKRKRRQYFDKFSQLSLCNCKADIYEAGSLIAACVFVQCSQISGPEPCLANLRAYLHLAKERSNNIPSPTRRCLQLKLQISLWFAGSPVGASAACPEGDVPTVALQPVWAAHPLCWAAGLLCLGKSEKGLVCG